MSSTAVLRRAPQRGWSEQRTLATNTILALLIAVAGLVAAGSFSLTSRADTGPARVARPQTATVDLADVGRRSAALQAALLAEVAAQRGDALARDAQQVTRTALSEAGSVRQQQLTTAQVAVQAAATQLAQEKLEAAIAARQAAFEARMAAEAEAAAAEQQAAADASQAARDQTQTAEQAQQQAMDRTQATGTTGTLPAGTRGVLPIASGVVGAGFGATGSWATYHTGLDFRAAYGTPIHAVLPGIVVFAGSSADWAGIHVAVRHADGSTTMYSHMSLMNVQAGQQVQAGEVLGHVGQTGRAFGPHLHFEVYPPGVRFGDVYRAINPIPYLSSIGVRTR